MQYRVKWFIGAMAMVLFGLAGIWAASESPAANEKKAMKKKQELPSSYAPVVIEESFATIFQRMTAAKPKVMARQMALLKKRYDLSNRPAQGVTMTKARRSRQGCGPGSPKA